MATLRFLAWIAVILLVTYASGTIIAFDLNPGHWGWFLRAWCMVWAVFWGIVLLLNFEPHSYSGRRRKPVSGDIGRV
jgi:hypothetical protein